LSIKHPLRATKRKRTPSPKGLDIEEPQSPVQRYVGTLYILTQSLTCHRKSNRRKIPTAKKRQQEEEKAKTTKKANTTKK
jgi:hypothetical protein